MRVVAPVVLASARRRARRCGAAPARAARSGCPCGRSSGRPRCGLLGHVDLALPQALEQVVGRQVDQLDLVGSLEDRVGHGLAHGDAGDLRDDVVQALEVLDVERRVDVDAGVEQLLDVLPALGVARARARWCGPARRPGAARAGARARRRGRTRASGRAAILDRARRQAARARRAAPRSRRGRGSRPSRRRRRRPRRAGARAASSIA